MKIRAWGLLVALTLLAAFAADSWGQSQKQSKPPAQPPAADQRGTDQVPLTVKVIPSQPSEEQTKKEEAEKHEKAEIDKKLAFETQRIADYTDRLALFTVFLFCVAVSQAGLFVWQLLYMRQGMTDAATAANAAKESATAAVKQSEAIIQAERPYAFLKIIEPGLVMGSNDDLIRPDITTHGRLRFQIINAGRTPAMLEEFRELYVVTEGRIDAPVPLDPMKDRGRLMPVGTIATADGPYVQATNLFAEANVPDIRKMLLPAAWASRRLFFQGFIRYSDAFGNHYITGFLAAFSPEHGAWALRGGNQYNYSRQEKPEEIPPHPDYPGEN